MNIQLKPILLASACLSLVTTGCVSSTDWGLNDRASVFKELKPPVDLRASTAQKLFDESANEDSQSGQESNPDSNDEDVKDFQDRSRSSQVPSLAVANPNKTEIDTTPPAFVRETVGANIPPLELPIFIDTVFGRYLEVPYTTGPGIANRKEVVQLRSAGEMESKVFLELVTMALLDYGVRISVQNGVYQILEDDELKARAPQFIKSRARSTTPANLRPVVQFVELNAIDAGDMAGILRQALGRNNKSVSIDAANDSNFIILSGLPSDIEIALDIIYQMDELDYAGTQVQRYSPAYWRVSELQKEMRTLLEAEGWQASVSPNLPKTILLLAVDYSNDLMVFTRSKAARDRVNYWLKELDQPSPQGNISELFVYNVQNMDAQLLVTTVNSVLSGQGGAPSVDRPGGVNSGQGIGRGGSFGSQGGVRGPRPGSNDQATGLPSANTRLVVDTIGNRLIFSGTASDYQRLLPLLKQLDTAPAEVLIEVTIADINITDSLNYGVEWSINNLGDPSATPRIGALENGSRVGEVGSNTSTGDNLFDNFTGAIASNGGLTAILANNNASATLQAAAANGDVRILSTPRIVTRSGSAAQVQVGSDVPVISSQSSANVALDQGILNLQTVEYRSTGVLLAIEPIVYGNNRIDLRISQELSNTSATTTAGISSPIFANTSISTELSLADGATAVIGGLIQETLDQSNDGIPFLKDLPLVGNAFKSTDISSTKREIVILITAYVLQGQDDKDALVNEYSRSFNRTSELSRLVTLRPRDF